jgi:hypothetical protein
LTESNAEAANGAAVRSASPGFAGSMAQPSVEERSRPEESGRDQSAALSKPLAESPDDSPDEPAAQDSQAGMTKGIWWAAALLPFLSVAGAVLCFAAGVLNSGGCQPEGSALCSSGGQWFTFVLPLLVSPLTAAVTAIAAVTLRKHRSSWLAAGYFVVFVSVLIGLASANSGSS